MVSESDSPFYKITQFLIRLARNISRPQNLLQVDCILLLSGQKNKVVVRHLSTQDVAFALYYNISTTAVETLIIYT
jgi:hypothetical protein